MFKKLFVVCFILIITVINIKATTEPITLQLWDWYIVQSKFLDNEIKLFEEKYPYIKVKRTKQLLNRYRDLVNYAFRSSTLPDVLAIPVDVRLEWMRAGYFLPIDDFINEEFINRFPKGSFMSGINIYNGKYYSFPVNGGEVWCQLYLNTDVFKKAGLVDKNGEVLLPKTWNDIRKYAKIVTKKGQGKFYGFGFSYRPDHLHANMFYEWARLAGARGGPQDLAMGVDYKIGRYNFTTDGALEGYTRMFKFLLALKKDKSLYPNCLSIDDEQLRAAFADGKIAMIMGGSWNMKGWETTHPNFKEYECLMVPPPDEKGYRALFGVNLANVYHGIGANTKYPAEAWKLMSWFASPEVGERYVRAGLGLSIFPSANSMKNAKYRQFGQYMEISSTYSRSYPNPFARNPELANVVVKPVLPNHIGVFWGVMSGQIKEKDIPAQLKSLEDRMNKALEEGFEEAVKKGYNVNITRDLTFPDWDPLQHYEQK